MLLTQYIKRITLLLFMTTISLQADSQWVGFHDQTPNNASVSILNDDLANTELEFQLPGYYRDLISIAGTPHLLISAPEMTPLLKTGAPDLPKYYRSIIIPDDSRMQLRVEVLEYHDIPVEHLTPSKGNLTRDINPASVPFQFGNEYQRDQFYPEHIASLGQPYVMRDLRGAVVQIHPFRYNPVAGVLRIYTQLRISLETDGPARQGLKAKASTSLQHGFLSIYKNHFINSSTNTPLYDLPLETGNLLIIAADEYYDATLPLVEWKRTRGLATEIVPVSELGNNATAILGAVQSRYNSFVGLTFLLLVGDAADVAPAMASGAASDPSYALLDGGNGDQYPDIFVGRLSANTIAQVETQVAKIIEYEANPDPAGDWYHKAMGIASNQGAGQGDDGEADNVHMDNIRTDLLGFGYDPVDQIYDPTASAALVTSGVNDGRSLINYVGHGSNTSWSTTGFSSSHVSSLNNTGKLPVIVSVACVNGNFQNTTCFAEAWMRAGSASDQRGAVAFYGSTINQSWAPPMCAQDEFNDLLVAEAQMTIGALMFSGSAQMIDEYGSDGFDMYATWHIFGDPSMPIRTQTPQPFTTITAPDVLILGSSQLSVNTGGIDNAIISLSKNGVLLDAAAAALFGTTTLNFEPLTEVDTCLLTVTGPNAIPWQQELLIIAPDGPYLIAQGFLVNDLTEGNGNGLIDFGETVNLDFLIHNVGSDTCQTVDATLTLDDPYVTLVSNLVSSGFLLPGDTMAVGPFEILISATAPDGYQVLGSLIMTNGETSWESNITLTIQAPAISLVETVVLDTGNGRLDIGESAALELCLNNEGGSGLTSATLTIASNDPFVAALGSSFNIDNFESGNLSYCTFDIDLEYATPPGHELEFSWVLESDQGYSTNGTFSLLAGLVVEDFESADFGSYDWIMGGHQDWTIDNGEFSEGQYSARSGAINNYQNSEMSVFVDVDDNAVLSFNYKVSSQAGADGLDFLIDGVVMDNWQGEIPWSEASYPLTVGEHELAWKYTKNSSGASGSDCAWVDFIILPLSEVPGTIIGDVNADAQINVQDIVRLVSIILGQGADAQEFELYCGNINGDETVDIGDLVLLVNIIMGEQLARPALAGSFTAILTDETLVVNSDLPLLALDLSYQGLLATDLDDYQLARTNSNGVTHLVIYTLEPDKASRELLLGEVNSDFELLNIQAAFSSGQVLAAKADRTDLPDQFMVYPNFPNPFNPQTTIRYDLANAGALKIQIYDIQGREIRTFSKVYQTAGQYELIWNGADNAGHKVESGLYFCRITSGSQGAVLKLMLMK